MADAIRVVHVDDEAGFAEVAAAHLERADDAFEVEPATSAADGLALVDEDVDCVVSDYEMPETDGIEFLEAVRERRPELPFVLFTGKGSETVASDAISAGVTDYLQKGGPETYDILANRIRNAVEGYRAREAVADSEQRLRSVYERITDGFFAVDTDWRYTYVNEEGARLVGRDRAELLGRTVWEAFPEIEGSPFEDALRRAMDSQDTTTVDEYYPAHDTWYDVRVYPADDGISIYFKDVSERKERERELEQYRTLTSAANDVLVTIDENSVVESVNPAVETVFGYEPSELVGEPITTLMRESDRDRHLGGVERYLETGERRLDWDYAELTGRRADGETLPVGVSFGEIEMGGERYFTGIVRDITERKRRERRLERQKARVETLHDVATDIEACETPDAVFELLVAASEEVLDFDIALADEVQDGVLVPVAVSSEIDADQFYDETPVHADDNLAAEAYRTGESSIVRDLGTVDVAPADSVFRSALTVPIGEYGVFQTVATSSEAFDAEERELVELLVAHAREQLARLETERQLRDQADELRRKNDRLEEFTSVVSHDLQNPLNVAKGSLETVEQAVGSDDVDDLRYALDRMQRLIEELLTLAREGEAVSEMEPVDLAGTVEACWENVPTVDASLAVETTARICADRSRLRQLLENLVANAVTHGGADVTVTVGDTDGGFYVADDGPGIPSDEREAVFGSGYSTTDEGTGFGLAIVNRIAEAHGWAVAVGESATGGARFEISGVERVD